MPTIEPTQWIDASPPTIALTRASDLESQPDAAFELAQAADGLALAIHVRRAVNVRRPVLSALGAEPALTRELEPALAEIERVTRRHSLGKRIVRFGNRAYYESAGSVASHFGQTLLARMIGAVSPMVLPQDVATAREPTRFENSALLSVADLHGTIAGVAEQARDEQRTSAPVTFGRDARLWIGISRDTPNLAAAAGSSEALLATARPLVFESLLGVRSARWHVRARVTDRTRDGRLTEQAAYIDALQAGDRVGWSVSRADAARLVAELARAVDREWHAAHRVHGDLKPGNVLLTQHAIRAFDALDVAEGGISPGVTEGWAAPEQIFVRPLSPATDVFALALIACAALSAAVFGEETAVVVPAVGDGRRRLRMIKDPEVWLDPRQVALPDEARVAWRNLLVRCLAADPERRLRRGGELADQMDSLLDRWEIPGRLAVASGPGRMQFFVTSGQPVWMLDDRG